jgi:hypothetical protein
VRWLWSGEPLWAPEPQPTTEEKTPSTKDSSNARTNRVNCIDYLPPIDRLERVPPRMHQRINSVGS